MTGSGSQVVRVGTRGSLLARTQTGIVVDALRSSHPGVALETIIIRTSGDRNLREVTGAFVVELQEALLRGDVDLAVHSMKDLPTLRPSGLTIAAVPAREAREDAVVSVHPSLAALPLGARVGAGSVRRSAQLRTIRPDLLYAPLVGNVDTRLRKLLAGDYDAIVLSVAGMRRLGYPIDPAAERNTIEFEARHLHVDVLPPSVVLPAPGQGALAIECRADDAVVRELAATIDCPDTASAVTAERALLGALGGGCRTPIGASASVDRGTLRLEGVVVAPDGLKSVRGSETGPTSGPTSIGERLAARLMAEGARELLAACR